MPEYDFKTGKFVKDTIVIGMMASPYGTGWTKNEQLLEYYRESRDAGITGHEVTLTAASMNWDDLMQQHHAFKDIKGLHQSKCVRW